MGCNSNTSANQVEGRYVPPQKKTKLSTIVKRGGGDLHGSHYCGCIPVAQQRTDVAVGS